MPALPRAATPRIRLDHALVDGLACPLTVVAAPAGFGKTTLVVTALRATPRRVAWLSLDDGDNDPFRFALYVVSALDTACPGLVGDALSLLQATQPPALEQLFAVVINALAGATQDFVLVLDDYHAITNPVIHRTLTFLLDHQPHALRLVLTSRSDPPLPLARLRARGQLSEIRAADPRFTIPETAAFLCESMGLDLSTDDVAALEARTEGWAAGLQLAALAARGHANPSAFIAGFAGSHRFVLDYLAEDVLQAQPEPVQHFLLRTSILNRFCADLCDAVTGEHDGQAMLEYAEASNLFLIPLDEERRWYRYHHLFVDVLRGLLRRQNPEEIPALYRRATAWHTAHGLPGEAIRYVLAGGDAAWAADLIEQAGWATYWHHGELATLRGWLGALPEDVVRARPRLCLLHA